MKIYLAAAWSRKNEIASLAQELNKIPGIEVNARWLHEPTTGVVSGQESYGGSDVFQFRQARALYDVEDVTDSDMLIRFTDDLSGAFVPARLASGARMFEMGLAYAQKKPIVVVGGFQPIFDYLPGIIHLRCPAELKQFLLHPLSEAVKNVRA